MIQDTLVIGAGPAGLAVAAALRVEGCAFTVLEASDRLAASWRKHYPSLRLHTSKAHSALPGLPMSDDLPRYPSRDQVIDYLQNYAQAKELLVAFGKRVVAVRKESTWVVETSDGQKHASKAVVIATGLAHTPVKPSWEGQDTFEGPIIHSSEYRDAQALNAHRVLVVGFGNSAGDIALGCAEEGLQVSMSVRGPVNVVSLEVLGIPSATIAILQRHLSPRLADAINAPILKWRYRDLERLGLRRANDGPLTAIAGRGRTPLIDTGTIAKIREGTVSIHPAIERSNGATIHFANQRSIDCDAIVLASGFRPALEALLPDLADRFPGADRPARNDLQPAGDGLYFCGFNPAATGLLRQIGMEAEAIAASIAQIR